MFRSIHCQLWCWYDRHKNRGVRPHRHDRELLTSLLRTARQQDNRTLRVFGLAMRLLRNHCKPSNTFLWIGFSNQIFISKNKSYIEFTQNPATKRFATWRTRILRQRLVCRQTGNIGTITNFGDYVVNRGLARIPTQKSSTGAALLLRRRWCVSELR